MSECALIFLMQGGAKPAYVILERSLNLRDSTHFRPDIHFEKINIENIHWVSSAGLI